MGGVTAGVPRSPTLLDPGAEFFHLGLMLCNITLLGIRLSYL